MSYAQRLHTPHPPELAPELARLVRPGGRLAMCGVREDQGEEVLAAYRALAAFDSLSICNQAQGWILITGTRKP